MKALRIDPANAVIVDQIETEKRKVEGLYYVTDKGMIPIAYLMKLEHHNEIEADLAEIRRRRKELAKFEYETLAIKFYGFRI